MNTNNPDSITISIKQANAALLLAKGNYAVDVAKKLDICQQTISEWKKNPEFDRYLNMLRKEFLTASRDEMRSLASDAVSTVKEVMVSGKTDTSRLKAAEIVLAHVGMTNPASGLWGWGID